MSDQVVLRSARLYLRRLERTDVGDDYVRWLNDPEVTRYLVSGREPVSREDLLRYLERFEGSSSDFIFAIIDRASDRHVGNVTLNRIDRVQATADTGIMIGERSFWGRGYASEAWSLLVGWSFAEVGLRQVTAGVCAPNVASARALRTLGFRLVRVDRDACLIEGTHFDALRFGVQSHEFQPLRPMSITGEELG